MKFLKWKIVNCEYQRWFCKERLQIGAADGEFTSPFMKNNLRLTNRNTRLILFRYLIELSSDTNRHLGSGWVWVEFKLSSGWVQVEFGMIFKLYYRISGSYCYCFLFYICLPCFFWRRANNGRVWLKLKKGQTYLHTYPLTPPRTPWIILLLCIALQFVILGICFDQWFCSFGNFETSYTY